MMAAATEARAASGATAAPIAKQGQSLKENHQTVPALGLLAAAPMRVHATSGWWNWNWSGYLQGR